MAADSKQAARHDAARQRLAQAILQSAFPYHTASFPTPKWNQRAGLVYHSSAPWPFTGRDRTDLECAWGRSNDPGRIESIKTYPYKNKGITVIEFHFTQ